MLIVLHFNYILFLCRAAWEVVTVAMVTNLGPWVVEAACRWATGGSFVWPLEHPAGSYHVYYI